MKNHPYLQPVDPENQTVVVVYGPPCSGKTLNADKIRRFLKCDTIADDGMMTEEDATYGHRILVLADNPSPRDPRRGRRRGFLPPYESIPIEKIAKALGIYWTKPGPLP
jgi:hypothetical protein